MFRLILIGGLSASLLANGILLFKMFDAGVSLDHRTVQSKELEKGSDVLLKIARHAWKGKPSAELEQLGQQLSSQGIVVKKDGESIEIGNLKFLVENGRISSIQFIR